MNKNGLNAIALADLHFGPTNNPNEIYNTLQQIVYPYIQKTEPDIIVVCGDDTEERLDLSQIAARFYLQFVYDITHFKKRNGQPIAVRWIKGTETHTKNQLQSLYYLAMDVSLNVKIIETVSEECFHGYEILYVPEESVLDKQEHYANTLYGDKQYDYAFGHGMFDFVAFTKDINTEKSLRGTPTFIADEFRRVVKYFVIFGHIHIFQNYKNFIYYPGSLTRFRQNEKESKGFIHIYNNSIIFVENPFAKQYLTFTIPKTHKDESVEQIIRRYTRIAEDNSINDIRVLVGRDELESSKLLELKNYFVQHPEYRVRIEIKREEVKNDIAQSGSHEHEIINVLSAKFPDIIDPNDVLHNTISYCAKSLGVNVTREQIENIIIKSKAFDAGML
jgi:hypothetical protein